MKFQARCGLLLVVERKVVRNLVHITEGAEKCKELEKGEGWSDLEC